ncbi:4-hydroxy-tetrahydrodipicolinate synthase [Denitrobaculum tricleocarpae]|uniref:4-hydroxy-tetrahydrodipicolinate synthase n=1 Tax=Denitrobaculum tricleocarpae TaxID=2591009 RepID=A0A545U0U3_9PROT|nr:4-hydroxy-tetrahydrodipicolinate synthase [Denitrobaculum tricleocarpae]TQV83101.1 4-hydroxy-tetrahydrodipicolinate synthase [Denitrobaculum tricleocarpae]
MEKVTRDPNSPGLSGLWLPLITPFLEGALDEASTRRLVAHYLEEPVDGLILAATTGEGLTLEKAEVERLVAVSAETIAEKGRDLPLYLGLSGSDTRKLVKALARTADWPIVGYLIACPYYSRPSQAGLFQHFTALAEGSSKPIMIYNIPYRTGVNLENETLLRLAEHPNIVGLKDCCADASQSFELLRDRPEGFAVLTGEDALYYSALVQGADGGILASGHVMTADFAGIRTRLLQGDQPAALRAWQQLSPIPRLLFSEPSPAAAKHWLWRSGLIASPEVRLPITPATEVLARQIDREIAQSVPSGLIP